MRCSNGYRVRAAAFFPVQIEARQIFAQPVCIVGLAFLAARDSEQFASGFRETGAALADFERGVAAEKVADPLSRELRAYLESGGAVTGYMADQLVLPMALAGAGAFTTSERASHLVTNIAVIERFLPVDIRCEPVGAGWQVKVCR